MELLIYIAIIVGFYFFISFVKYIQYHLEKRRLKNLLRKNKKILESIDFGKFNENLQIYQDYFTKKRDSIELLHKPKILNEKVTKSKFLYDLYKKYHYSNEMIKDVIFK